MRLTKERESKLWKLLQNLSDLLFWFRPPDCQTGAGNIKPIRRICLPTEVTDKILHRRHQQHEPACTACHASGDESVKKNHGPPDSSSPMNGDPAVNALRHWWGELHNAILLQWK